MNYDIDTLVALKEEFQSSEFQWIKPYDKSKLAKIVEVRDIVPISPDAFGAILSDGSRINTEDISTRLMMINEDQPALSLAEVQSLNYIPGLADEDAPIDSSLPADFRNQGTSRELAVTGGPIQPTGYATLPTPIYTNPSNSVTDTTDLFGLFSLEDTELILTIRIQLPEKNLLKMMYSNSKDKESFLAKLSNYINNKITPSSIKETVEKLLGNTKKKKTIDDTTN